MKYLQRSFTVKMGENEAFRSNYDRIFGKTPSEPVLSDSKPVLSSSEPVLSEPLPDPLQRDEVVSLDIQREKGRFRAVLVHLPLADHAALQLWATEYKDESPLDPDVAHTVLMAVADAVTSP